MVRNKHSKRTDDNVRTDEHESYPESKDSKTKATSSWDCPLSDEQLLNQVRTEYKVCYDSQISKLNENMARLRLYNNQSRDKKRVGDPLLFTVFNTVFSGLYDDSFQVTFEAVEKGDIYKAEDITNLAKHDYQKMQKSKIDYDWDWNTCFFGRGLVLLEDFDFSDELMCPVAEVIDNLTWLRDPNATSVNGDMRGNGAMRFGGRPIGLTKSEMKERGYDCEGIKKDTEVDDLLRQARQERHNQQGTQSIDFSQDQLTENYEYSLIEWYTIIHGERWCITVANGKNKIVKAFKLKQQKRWGIIDRTLFPMSFSWDGVSIPDLIEDKQRARAIMINLGLDAAKADLHPMYLYNKKKITNKRDLDFGFNKGVGVDGSTDGAYTAMNKATAITNQVQTVLSILDVAAQKAVAAPEIAQGVTPSQARTATENEIVAAGRGARMSLAASLWADSEEDFWKQWYFLYKKHFTKKLGEKIIRINGPLTKSYKALTADNIITHIDPDVVVISKAEQRAKMDRERAEFMPFAQLALQDPTVNRRFLFRKMGRLSSLTEDEMFFLFPPTADELKAEDENEILEDGTFVPVSPEDDDMMHIEMHLTAEQTPEVIAHILAHKRMLYLKQSMGLISSGNQPLDQITPVRGEEQQEKPSVTQQRAELIQPNPQGYDE